MFIERIDDIIIPTGFEGAAIYTGSDRCAAKVISCDNSAIIDTGLIRQGEQLCRVELLGGLFKGRETDAVNLLNGSLVQDKIFAEGDKAYVLVSYRDSEILSVTMAFSESLLYNGYNDLNLTKNIYGKHIYRLLGSGNGSGGGHNLRSTRGNTEKARQRTYRSDKVGT